MQLSKRAQSLRQNAEIVKNRPQTGNPNNREHALQFLQSHIGRDQRRGTQIDLTDAVNYQQLNSEADETNFRFTQTHQNTKQNWYRDTENTENGQIIEFEGQTVDQNSNQVEGIEKEEKKDKENGADLDLTPQADKGKFDRYFKNTKKRPRSST